jgi:hypothetical protein
MTGKHCPHMQEMKAWSPANSAEHHSCCNDAATVAKTGQHCKTGHACSPSLSYFLPSILFHLAFITDVRQSPAVPLRALAGSPSAVWRPPTLV